MRIILLSTILWTIVQAQKSSLYKASEKYQPIRHDEEQREITEKDVKMAVSKMKKLLGWKKKKIDVGIEIQKVQTPWLNQTYWDSLHPRTRWNLRKAYYEKQRELDKLRERRKELVQKEEDERERLTKKFVDLVKERGKRIAFYFVEQYQAFKKKEKKAAKGKLDEPWSDISRSGKSGPTERPPLGKQPHILFILADDYGFHDIGYHMSEILTPNMDKLAKEGVILENYYVQQVCTPTRAQLMTGRYQIRYGMQHGVVRPPQPDGIPLDEKLIPDALKQCGYNTEMIGKWHLGFFQKDYCPQNRGFDHFLGFLTGSEDFYTHQKCFFGMCGYDFREAYPNQPEVIRYDLNDTYSTGIFVDGLDKRLAKLDPKVPLFTYLSFQSVHSPLQAPKGFIDIYRNIKNRKRRNYNAMVTAMDKAVADVVRSYKKYDFWENTVLIFSSDNGGNMKAGASNWPLRGAKGTLYEGGVRSIGFVHSPLLPLNRMGTVSHNLMHVTDWFPTILHLAGCKGLDFGGKPLDGVSQVPALWSEINENYAIRNEILHALDPLSVAKQMKDPRGNWKANGGVLKDRSFKIQVSSALRMGKWKLHTGHAGATSGWGVPPTSLWGNATSIFDQIVLPESAYVDDVKADVKHLKEKVPDCEEEACPDAKPSRRRKRNVKWFQRSRRATTEAPDNGARSGVFRPLKPIESHVVGGISRSSSFKPIRNEDSSLSIMSGKVRPQIFNDTMTEEEAHAQLMSRSHRSFNSMQRQIEKKEKQIARKQDSKKRRNKKKGKLPTKGFEVNLVQLYNIEDDPTEKKDVSSVYPKVVNIMLTKLADYYDAQVEPRYPAYDPSSDPDLFGGVWKPWRKSEDELDHLNATAKAEYIQETANLFNHVDESERRKLNLAKSTAELKSAVLQIDGPMATLKMAGVSRSNIQSDESTLSRFSIQLETKNLTPEEREMKKMAKSFFLEEKLLEKEMRKNDRKTTRVRSG